MIEIQEGQSDWIDMQEKQLTNKGDPMTDLLAFNYFSDGKTLNSILWLYFPFKDSPIQNSVNYGMLVDTDFNDNTGYYGVDYKYQISWNNKTKVWNSTLEKWSPIGKVIQIYNEKIPPKNFSQNGTNYVKLSVDLGMLGYPERYKVMFYAESKKEGLHTSDLTRWVAVPPLELGLLAQPNTVELRKGEIKVIELAINASSGYEPTVSLSAKSSTKGIKLDFNGNDTLHMPSYGAVTTPLTIIPLAESIAGQYTIVLFANSTFPPKELINLKNETTTESQLAYLNRAENIITQSSLIIKLQDELSPLEKIGYFWSNAGDALSFFSGIVTGISPWIFKKLREKLKNKKRKKNG
jgi:hypothetical protein